MIDEDAMREGLVAAPVRRLRTTLVRCVALLPLTGGGAPDYLFTSGRANRYNPAGLNCVYFSENERTARAEYGRRLGLGLGALQPLGTYYAEVSLASVLDLCDDRTLKALELKPTDLTVKWPLARKPTRSQALGSRSAFARAAICPSNLMALAPEPSAFR